MDQKVLQVIVQFMNRVNLTGAEVPAFITCMQELQKLAVPEATLKFQHDGKMPPGMDMRQEGDSTGK